ncbi:hypothetical protein AZA_26623 [Nitrospirillum viridazoti Y2]|uniref:Uncharacterized protein n=1 Tax=Nitrospirillum amazonense TaxID=28077 RepID=A0A560IUK0_9PROT|nr:hypothetical protein [Nitrospirillum amazonense]EGX99729.1 hypothetical protein AZA_26623 [Nitrospirillum amazonense Y2]TWB62241.1 hypothetical protein FBZ92_105176 [Nitrospirillum amazonense]
MKPRSFLLLTSLLAISTQAGAQSYPSPTFNNVAANAATVGSVSLNGTGVNVPAGSAINLGEATPQTGTMLYTRQTVTDAARAPYAINRVDGIYNTTGGTEGNISSPLVVYSEAHGAPAFGVWGISSNMYSDASGAGGGVPIVSSMFRTGLTGGASSNMWGFNSQMVDETGLSSSHTAPTWGYEVDLWANGDDDTPYGWRTGVDFVYKKQIPGGAAVGIGNGFRIGPQNGDFSQGYVQRGFLLNGKYSQAGLDMRTAVPMAGAVGAIALSQDQHIAVVADGSRFLTYHGTGNSLGYANGSYDLLNVDDFGNVTAHASVNAPAFSNGGAPPNFPQGLSVSSKILLNAAGTRYINYNSTGGYFEYGNGSYGLLDVDDFGNVTAHASLNAPAFSNGGSAPNFPQGLTIAGKSVLPNLAGTSAAIGGSSIAAGACTSGTVSISGATTSMAVAVSSAGSVDPGDGYFVRGYVSASGTVTIKVCNATGAGGTPTSTTYNVRVIQ